MRKSRLEMVGRRAEKDLLANALDNASKGNGQIALIGGEAGIGKSTLTGFLETTARSMGMGVCVGDCTIQDAGIPYVGFQRALSDYTDDSLFSLEDFAYFDEIFLISKIGLLISHVSRSENEGIDEDILGSMLTAVQDFVKDSFGDGKADDQKGGLGKLEYLDTKVTIEHGDLVYLAVVTSGEEHPDMKKDIKKCLSEIEETYFDILMDWDGDLDSLAGSVEMLKSLATSKYRVKRSLENINISAERLKVQNRIHEIVETNTGENGLLLVLEDIHWADESTLLAIPFIARNIIDSKVMLCLTYRPEDLEDNVEHMKILETLGSSPRCTDIVLESLDEETLDSLVCRLLDDENPPDELIDNLKSETDGNPFFIIEAIHALIAEGTLYKDKDIWILKHSTKSTIPHSVVELVSRRLETLEPDCLRFVEYGAILGRRFSVPLLCSGFRLDNDYITETIERLVSLSIFDWVKQDELIFQHSKIQEVIYSGMSQRWKRVLHKNAGQTLETYFKNDLDSALFSLAYHFSRTLEYDKGINYCISAGYKASNNFAPREAASFFETAIRIIDQTEREDERYPELNNSLGALYELDGNYDKALSTYDNILGNISGDKEISEIFMKMGRVFQAQGNYDKAIDLFNTGIKVAKAAGSDLLVAKIDGYMGKIYLRKGDYEQALMLQQAYLAESRKAGENLDMALAYMNLGGVYWHLSDYPMAINNWLQSLQIFKEIKYTQGIANANDNLGVGYFWSGNFEKALEHYQNSVEIMQKLGDVKGLSMAWNNMGVLYDRIGQQELALEYFRKSLQIKKKIGDSVGEANIYNNIGAIYYDHGEYETAIDNYRINLDYMEESGDTWGIAQALNNMAESQIELGLIDLAYENCDTSMALAKEHNFNDILASVLRLMAIISSDKEDYQKADELFEESLKLSMETEEPQRIGMAYLSFARSYNTRGDREKAVDNYANALKLFEDNQMETLARKARNEMKEIVDSLT